MKRIDDDKFKRIKEIIKLHGLSLNEKQISDNSSDCSANSCPLAKVCIKILRDLAQFLCNILIIISKSVS